ncbi:MAG: diadenylate cyclase CdaA [Salibacteraceae bacterium]
MGSIELFGFLPLGVLDLIDILLVSFLIFKLYELVRGTIAIRIFFGVLSIYLVWLTVTALEMQLMSQIFRQFINVGVIALIIVFQQEIRRFLLAIGNSAFFRNIGARGGLWSYLGKTHQKIGTNLHALSEAVYHMAESRTGALIVIERNADLNPVIESGRKMNADMNAALLESIFFKNSPLHDGAVIIRGNRIVAASCTLPLTSKNNIPNRYGMRHKAAIGATEEYDVVAIVVSEERGDINIVHSGLLDTPKDKNGFRDRLHELLSLS